MKNTNKKSSSVERKDEMSRREAVIKGSKYAAFTAAAMLTFYSPKKAQATSAPSPTKRDGWG